MRARTIVFWARRLLLCGGPFLLLAPVVRKFYASCSSESFEGVQLCNQLSPDTLKKSFVEWTKQALSIIRDADPRRFRRLQREIGCVIDTLLQDAAARYLRYARLCRVDFSRFYEPDNQAFAVRRYAHALVHEATHGAMHSLHFAYTRTTRLRIERICDAEANRFAARLGPPWDTQLALPFDQSRWTRCWTARVSDRWRWYFGERRSRLKAYGEQTHGETTSEPARGAASEASHA